MVKKEKPISFKIKMPLIALGDVSVVVDGINLTDKIRSLTLHAVVGELTKLTITFAAGVDIEGEAIVKLLDHTGEPLIERNTEETDA